MLEPVKTIARRILVVDDNDAIHRDFRKILLPEQPTSKLALAKAALFGAESVPAESDRDRVAFEVDSALQGQEAFKRVEEACREGRPYAVAFVDMRMPPGWNGLETIRRLWAVDAELQIVICSAYSDQSWNEISQKLGLTDRLLILKKPFDPQEVVQLAVALSEKWILRQRDRCQVDYLETLVRERTETLTQLALHDKLTGLANRTLFVERLEGAVRLAELDERHHFAVLFLDFDRFKLINDSLGHEAGDRVLRGIADRLTTALKPLGLSVRDAVAARLGGDEFTILLDGLGPTFDVAAFADSLLPLLASPHDIDGRVVHCTASIGVTTSELRYERAADVLRDADTAMYNAKSQGKNRCVRFDRRMHEAVARRLEMENDLQRAVGRDELFLVYQPIVSLATGSPEGFEALIRWKHPTRGLVTPSEFIPCCEEIGLVVPIGLWAMRQACRQLRAWIDAYPHLSHLTMSINLSPRQLAEPALVEQVRQVLKETGVTPSSIALEITETAMMKDPADALAVLRELHSLGVRLHLDDFGTGYSSLSALHQYPIDAVKIDRSFMVNACERRSYMAVVTAIVSLARHLGMKLIAEGIEAAEQISVLQSIDCELGQGYFFHRPATADVIERYLQARPPMTLAA